MMKSSKIISTGADETILENPYKVPMTSAKITGIDKNIKKIRMYSLVYLVNLSSTGEIRFKIYHIDSSTYKIIFVNKKDYQICILFKVPFWGI